MPSASPCPRQASPAESSLIQVSSGAAEGRLHLEGCQLRRDAWQQCVGSKLGSAPRAPNRCVVRAGPSGPQVTALTLAGCLGGEACLHCLLWGQEHPGNPQFLYSAVSSSSPQPSAYPAGAWALARKLPCWPKGGPPARGRSLLCLTSWELPLDRGRAYCWVRTNTLLKDEPG